MGLRTHLRVEKMHSFTTLNNVGKLKNKMFIEIPWFSNKNNESVPPFFPDGI